MLYSFTTMSEQPKYIRRQYLVDRAYQLQFVTRVFIAIFGIAVISSGIASIMLWFNMYRANSGEQTHLIVAFIAVSITLIVELLVSIPIAYYFGIRQSHRVVGPMIRLKRTLEVIGQGDYSQRITLRKGDALIELANQINKMAENLENRHSGSS